MTEIEFDALLAATRLRSPGEWFVAGSVRTAINTTENHVAMVNFYSRTMSDEEHNANVALIVAAPILLEEVARLRRENARLRARKDLPPC